MQVCMYALCTADIFIIYSSGLVEITSFANSFLTSNNKDEEMKITLKM